MARSKCKVGDAMRRPDTDDLNAAQQRAWSKNPDVDINNALLDGVVTGTPDGCVAVSGIATLQ